MEKLDIIFKLVELVILPSFIWMVKFLRDTLKDLKAGQTDTHASLEQVKAEVLALKITLIGYDGNNGLRSRIQSLEKWRQDDSK